MRILECYIYLFVGVVKIANNSTTYSVKKLDGKYKKFNFENNLNY
jgi:hypothetical protein